MTERVAVTSVMVALAACVAVLGDAAWGAVRPVAAGSTQQPAGTGDWTAAEETAGSAGTVELRFGGGRVTGKILSMTGNGLRMRPDIGEERTILWSHVGGVSGPAAGKFAATFAAMAEGVWRLTARVNRGDAEGAELLYDKLEASGTLDGLRGASRRAAMRTVIQLRLSRGFVTGAARAYFESLAATGALADEALVGGGSVQGSGDWGGESTPGNNRAAVDGVTGLCPNLPPAFSAQLSGGGLAALAQWPGWAACTALPGAAGEVARWYETEAISAAGGRTVLLEGLLPVMDVGGAATAGPEVLTRMVVQAARGNAEQRRAAREWLGRRLAAEAAKVEGAGAGGSGDARGAGAKFGEDGLVERSWQEAWCRLGIGRSLLAESDAADRRRGMLELLHVPAEFAQRLPLAAAVALSDVATELEKQGDLSTAAALRADLRQLLPFGGVDEEGRETGWTTGGRGAANGSSAGGGPTMDEKIDPETKK